jgi:hypothetical protein
MRPLLLAVSLSLLVGCATAYQPSGLGGGFTDSQIDANTFRVAFRGNGYTPRETVENYLLLRCAELTVERGFDHFVVLGSDTEGKAGSFTTPGTYRSTTTGSATAYGNYAYGRAYTRGTYTPGQTFHFTKYGATATIKTFMGPKPADAGSAFDAREVLSYLGPRVRTASGQPPATTLAPTVTPTPAQAVVRSSATTSPAAVDVSGTYRGTVSGDQRGRPYSAQVTVTLAQQGDEISGVWVMAGGGSGTLSGRLLSPTRAELRIEQVRPCAAQYTGAATIGEGGSSLGGSYTGSGCGGPVSTSFTIVRQ